MNLKPPSLGQHAPIYPLELQVLRVTSATPVSGNVYTSITQQGSGNDSFRDRENSFSYEPNGTALTTGYYLGRLIGRFTDSGNEYPLYAVVKMTGGSGTITVDDTIVTVTGATTLQFPPGTVVNGGSGTVILFGSSGGMWDIDAYQEVSAANGTGGDPINQNTLHAPLGASTSGGTMQAPSSQYYAMCRLIPEQRTVLGVGLYLNSVSSYSDDVLQIAVWGNPSTREWLPSGLLGWTNLIDLHTATPGVIRVALRTPTVVGPGDVWVTYNGVRSGAPALAGDATIGLWAVGFPPVPQGGFTKWDSQLLTYIDSLSAFDWMANTPGSHPPSSAGPTYTDDPVNLVSPYTPGDPCDKLEKYSTEGSVASPSQAQPIMWLIYDS